MKQLILSLLLTTCCLQAFAQQELIHPKEQQKQVMAQLAQPYIEVDGKQVAQASLPLIAAKHIESTEVLKDKKATDRFGDKAKDGAIIMKTKPAEWATIQDIYTQFGIPDAQQNMKVVINNQLVKDTSLILANLEQIEKVEVKKQDITAPVRWSMNDYEEFLYIISKPQSKQ
jgi:uncharacterized transporter YbjL